MVSRISDKYFVQGYLHTNLIGRSWRNVYAQEFPRTAGWWNGRTLRFYSATDCSSTRITGCPAVFALAFLLRYGYTTFLFINQFSLRYLSLCFIELVNKNTNQKWIILSHLWISFLNRNHSFRYHIDFMNVLQHRGLFLANGHKNLDNY